MIKLFSLKQQKKEEESAGGNKTGAGGKKASAAQLRIQKGTLPNGTDTRGAAPACLADGSPGSPVSVMHEYREETRRGNY